MNHSHSNHPLLQIHIYIFFSYQIHTFISISCFSNYNINRHFSQFIFYFFYVFYIQCALKVNIYVFFVFLHLLSYGSCISSSQHHGSLTLCLPLDFHNPLHYSPLRLIFLSNFYFFSVLFCTLVI